MCYAMLWSLTQLSITRRGRLGLTIPSTGLPIKDRIPYLMFGPNMRWESSRNTSNGLSTIQTISRPDLKCTWPLLLLALALETLGAIFVMASRILFLVWPEDTTQMVMTMITPSFPMGSQLSSQLLQS